jgi:hypothetical protein
MKIKALALENICPKAILQRVSLVMPMDALGVFQLTWAFETAETALSTIPKYYDDMIRID